MKHCRWLKLDNRLSEIKKLDIYWPFESREINYDPLGMKQIYLRGLGKIKN